MACLRATNDIPAIKTIKKLEKPNLEESNELGKTRRSESQAHSYGHSSKYEPEDADDHECDPDCLSLNEQTDKIEKYTALMRPGMVGWTRNIDKERSYYCTPCGKNLRTYNDIHKYLVKTNSKLRIDCFELNPKINLPTISLDIKEGMETDYVCIARNECKKLDEYSVINLNFLPGLIKWSREYSYSGAWRSPADGLCVHHRI